MEIVGSDKRDLNVLGNMAIFCVRYSLPRKTSADMACTTSLKAWWKHIPETQRKMIVEEIEAEKSLYGNDPFLWNDFLEKAKGGQYAFSKDSIVDEFDLESNKYGYIDELPGVGRVSKDKAFVMTLTQKHP